MTEHERRLKISKIAKYDERISMEKQNAINYALNAFMIASTSLALFVTSSNPRLPEILRYLGICLIGIDVGFCLENVIKLLKAYERKTVFEEEKSFIENELEYAKTEETAKGRR